jgi:hypothetical protein
VGKSNERKKWTEWKEEKRVICNFSSLLQGGIGWWFLVGLLLRNLSDKLSAPVL